MEKQRKIAGWILAGLLGFILIPSSISKFFDQTLIDNFTRYQLSDWRIIIAIGELISTLLFIWPKTRNFGGLLLSAFFGGTIVVHMVYQEPFYLQAALLIITWVTMFIHQTKQK